MTRGGTEYRVGRVVPEGEGQRGQDGAEGDWGTEEDGGGQKRMGDMGEKEDGGRRGWGEQRKVGGQKRMGGRGLTGDREGSEEVEAIGGEQRGPGAQGGPEVRGGGTEGRTRGAARPRRWTEEGQGRGGPPGSPRGTEPLCRGTGDGARGDGAKVTGPEAGWERPIWRPGRGLGDEDRRAGRG